MVYSLVLGSYIRLHNRFGNLIEGFSCAQALFAIDVYTVLSTTTHARTHTHTHTHTRMHSSLRVWDVNEKKKQLHVIKGRDKQGTTGL